MLNAYTNKRHKDLARVLLLVVDHGLGNGNLRTRSGCVQVALHAIRDLQDVRFALRLVERGGAFAMLVPAVDAEHGAVRRVERAQIPRHGAGSWESDLKQVLRLIECLK